MTNAWGIWTNEKVSKFNFIPAADAGASFAIGNMNTGWKKYNTNFQNMVQAAYDAGIRNIGGCYRVNPNEYEKMVDLMTYLEYPNGKFDGNFPIIKEIFEQVKNKYLSFLIIDFQDWWLEDGTPAHRKEHRVASEWYRHGARSILDYLRDHIRIANDRIDDRIVPMMGKWTIDNIYPELKYLLSGEIVCSDYNVRTGVVTVSNYRSMIGMSRPAEPMDVSYGNDWRFVRWANAAFNTDDFDAPIGIADFNGPAWQLSGWTEQPIGNSEPIQDDELETPPVIPPATQPVDITPELVDLANIFERISVQMMGAKHIIENIIDKLEE